MPSIYNRSTLTKAVLDLLAELGKPVGDGVFPNGGGWTGSPNTPGSKFIPYVVVLPMAASQFSGPFDDDEGDKRQPYALTSYGTSRAQCELQADAVRRKIQELFRTSVDLGTVYKVQQVVDTSVGGPTRVDVSDPPYWGQTDVLTIWLTPA